MAHSATEVRALAATATDLAELDTLVSQCRACPRLVEWREEVARVKRRSYADQEYWGRAVPSFGSVEPSVLIVGLAPAAHGANRTGRMFTGDRSGDWLYAALYRAGYANQPEAIDREDGLELSDARIVAPVHCAPPANRPTTEEIATCSGWFDQELGRCGPGLRSILALGGIAWRTIGSASQRLGWDWARADFAHGAQTWVQPPGRGPIKVVASYHVSQQNTFTGRLTTQMLDEVIALL